MATIKLVSRRDEAKGLGLATRLNEDRDVSAVVWWAGPEDSEPRLLVGFARFREEGPRAAVDKLSDALVEMGAEAPDYLAIDVIPSDDPRLQALIAHPWAMVRLDLPDLTNRFVNVWSRQAGMGQALVYFLRDAEETRVSIPSVRGQAA